MCCFSQPVKHVSSTNIFARALADGRQALVYSMKFAAAGELAMILPLPVPVGSPEDAVRFVSLEGYDDFFADMRKAFPDLTLSFGIPEADAAPAARQRALVVHDVGDFEASFVPALADMSRLDSRFELSSDVWDQLPQYRDFGFAVFKLKGDGDRQKDVHPMAFEFPRRDPRSLFFPTVHVHDGSVEEHAAFDHVLYCQPDPLTAATFSWESSMARLGRYVDADQSAGLIDPDALCFRRTIRGRRANRDQLLTPPKCDDPSRLVRRGACFELRLRATSAYEDAPQFPDWGTTAREHLDVLASAFPAQIAHSIEARRDAFGLADYDETAMSYVEKHGHLESLTHLLQDGTPMGPNAGEPLRVEFHVQSAKAEPQVVSVAFAAPPDAERIMAVRAALERALSAVEL